MCIMHSKKDITRLYAWNKPQTRSIITSRTLAHTPEYRYKPCPMPVSNYKSKSKSKYNVALIGSSGGGAATLGHTDAAELLRAIHHELQKVHDCWSLSTDYS